MHTQPQMTIFGPRGDITITWDAQDPKDEAEMIAYIQSRLDAGYLFFAIEEDTRQKLKTAEQARGRGKVLEVDPPAAKSSIVSRGIQKVKALLTGDEQLDALAERGVVTPTPVQERPAELGAPVRDAQTIARIKTASVRPLAGG